MPDWCSDDEVVQYLIIFLTKYVHRAISSAVEQWVMGESGHGTTTFIGAIIGGTGI